MFAEEAVQENAVQIVIIPAEPGAALDLVSALAAAVVLQRQPVALAAVLVIVAVRVVIAVVAIVVMAVQDIARVLARETVREAVLENVRGLVLDVRVVAGLFAQVTLPD